MVYIFQRRFWLARLVARFRASFLAHFPAASFLARSTSFWLARIVEPLKDHHDEDDQMQLRGQAGVSRLRPERDA